MGGRVASITNGVPLAAAKHRGERKRKRAFACEKRGEGDAEHHRRQGDQLDLISIPNPQSCSHHHDIDPAESLLSAPSFLTFSLRAQLTEEKLKSASVMAEFSGVIRVRLSSGGQISSQDLAGLCSAIGSASGNDDVPGTLNPKP